MEIVISEIGVMVKFGFEEKEKIFRSELGFEVRLEEVGEMVNSC